jgi:hypothetical protein
MKTINYFFAFLFVLLVHEGSSLVIKNDSLKPKHSDSLICLEISGRIYTMDQPANDTYTAELIEDNNVIESITKKDKRSFKFNLERNKYYAIRIVKEGYAPKLISINTWVTDEKFNDHLFNFSFKTELFTEEEFKVLDKDSQDFPIAIVVFNDQKKAFDYNEKYTGNIKKCLIKGIAFE